ncbi:MAG: S8 family serine peptidase [Planctomycetia bacterium]|nr:S8 family serine peptidase [Planctomycetia bacterium]
MRALGASIALLALVLPAQALDTAIPFDGGDVSRGILGPGTGVIVGFVDSGVNSAHPFLTGNDSLGQPRLVAQANFVTSEPANTGADVYGHGTAVAGVALGNDTINAIPFSGMAPDARYVNARVLDSTNSFATTDWVVNGLQFALANNADVINLSLVLNATQSDGNTQLDNLIDYIVDTRGVFVSTAAGNFGNAQPPHGIGAARNGFTMGALTANYSRVAPFSDAGATSDLRSKPNMVAPGDTITTANINFASGPLVANWTGTSFSSPQAAGMAAQLIDYGRDHSLSTDTRVLRAVMMNSAAKTLDNDGSAWAHTDTLALDNQQGAGRLDAVAAANQYIAGRFDPGTVPNTGWSLHDILGINNPSTTLEKFSLASTPSLGSYIDATLVWNRHIRWSDNGIPGVIDPADSFLVDNGNSPQDNLNLALFRDGVQVAQSVSSADTVENIHFLVSQAGNYELRVSRAFGFDPGETYSLAWHSVAVPEPAALALAAAALVSLPLLLRRRRQGRFSR